MSVIENLASYVSALNWIPMISWDIISLLDIIVITQCHARSNDRDKLARRPCMHDKVYVILLKLIIARFGQHATYYNSKSHKDTDPTKQLIRLNDESTIEMKRIVNPGKKKNRRKLCNDVGCYISFQSSITTRSPVSSCCYYLFIKVVCFD